MLLRRPIDSVGIGVGVGVLQVVGDFVNASNKQRVSVARPEVQIGGSATELVQTPFSRRESTHTMRSKRILRLQREKEAMNLCMMSVRDESHLFRIVVQLLTLQQRRLRLSIDEDQQ